MGRVITPGNHHLYSAIYSGNYVLPTTYAENQESPLIVGYNPVLVFISKAISRVILPPGICIWGKTFLASCSCSFPEKEVPKTPKLDPDLILINQW